MKIRNIIPWWLALIFNPNINQRTHIIDMKHDAYTTCTMEAFLQIQKMFPRYNHGVFHTICIRLNIDTTNTKITHNQHMYKIVYKYMQFAVFTWNFLFLKKCSPVVVAFSVLCTNYCVDHDCGHNNHTSPNGV